MAILRADIVRKYLIKSYSGGNNLKKQWYVEFHATDSLTGKWVRKKITVSTKLKTVPERLREVQMIEQSIIDMLIKNEGYINVKKSKLPEHNKFTIADTLNAGLRIVKTNVSGASFLTYSTAVNSFMAWLQLSGIADKPLIHFSGNDVKKYLLWLKENDISNMTHNSYKRLLHSVMKYFNEQHNYQVNVFDNIKEKKVEHSANLPYNDEQKKIILEWLRVHHFGLYCLCNFLYYLSPRIGELMKMRVHHLRQLQGFALIPGSSSKTDNTRRPELSINFIEFLETETTILQCPGNWYIFSGNSFLPGEVPQNANNANKRYAYCVKQIIKETGLYVMPRQNLYSWKSTGGFDLYRLTKDIQAVKTQMGHSNEATTWRYLKQKGVVDENVRALIREKQPKII